MIETLRHQMIVLGFLSCLSIDNFINCELMLKVILSQMFVSKMRL